MNSYFEIEKHGSSIRTEIIAGLTTFFTVAYIIIVNPKVLTVAGIPEEPTIVATILVAFVGTFLTGVYAKRPFAIAPYMGMNAFVAYTVVKVMGHTWQTAIGAILISGILLIIATVTGVRTWLAKAIPESLKIACTVGIGFFLTLIGLVNSGIIIGMGSPPVKIGSWNTPEVLLAIFGFLFIAILMMRKVKGAILVGIIATTLVGFALGVSKLPEKWLSMPPDISPILGQFDLVGALQWGFASIILTIVVMDIVDTIGTLTALSMVGGLLDEKGNLPEMHKPMLSDAIATTLAGVLGTTTAGTFIDSATGIEAGGRTGLTALVTSLMFLLALFISPFVAAIPAYAYSPALIVVGLLMVGLVAKLDFSDYSEAVPVFVTIILMAFTYNIGIGMTAGFIVYILFKLIAGRVSEISAGMWALGAISLLLFFIYPY
ncbi:MAG: NCS2 family permease [Ignavibacteriaceae bacterium]|nr:MAG: NCS2 family permease [Ignavibacteriaceae bacterium]